MVIFHSYVSLPEGNPSDFSANHSTNSYIFKGLLCTKKIFRNVLTKWDEAPSMRCSGIKYVYIYICIAIYTI